MGLLNLFRRKPVYIILREAQPLQTYGFDLRPKGLNTSKLKEEEREVIESNVFDSYGH